MAVHPIRIAGDPALHAPTTPVTEFDEALRELVADMFETNTAANGVGLAANQIGINKRVFIFDCPDAELGERRKGLIVNPVLETSTIPETMPDPDDDWEGCLSVPGESYPTGRADWAKVSGFDIDGQALEISGKGFFARCLQHETDHLDGFLYVDRLVGRHHRASKKMIKRNEWGIPGNSWLPGTDPDPFA